MLQSKQKLRAVNSAGECHLDVVEVIGSNLDVVEVIGSNPIPPTKASSYCISN